jgi:hypothetical protein
VPCKQLVP